MASIWKHPQCNNFFARFCDKDGKWRNASTGTANRAQARKLADEYEAAARGRRTATQTRRVISRLHAEITGETLPSSSVRAFVAHWLNEKKATSQSTQVFYRGSTSKFIKALGSVADDEISAISKEHVLNYRNFLLTRLSKTSANHDLKTVKMLFRAAKRDGYVVDDPSEFVETAKKATNEGKKRRPFTLDQIRAVLAVANDEWRSMILFALYTGQRLGDVARMTWANIDLERSQIRLVTQKTDKALTIPMAAPLKEHIENLSAPDVRPDLAPLHPAACAAREKGDGRRSTLSKEFSALLELAGLRKKSKPVAKSDKAQEHKGRRHSTGALSFHCLRHTAASLLAEAGIPAAVVQELIGWDSKQIAELYTHVGKDALTKAAAAFPVL